MRLSRLPNHQAPLAGRHCSPLAARHHAFSPLPAKGPSPGGPSIPTTTVSSLPSREEVTLTSVTMRSCSYSLSSCCVPGTIHNDLLSSLPVPGLSSSQPVLQMSRPSSTITPVSNCHELLQQQQLEFETKLVQTARPVQFRTTQHPLSEEIEIRPSFLRPRHCLFRKPQKAVFCVKARF